ncbi:MAG: prepilin-type N-terminal cleavage/methylation domain-containing protein [Sedimentisphaerales bacterium]|nr:prepilin-type N-terminal cleavage/methylation domain-containing protein [Sedimentisphaerales bacterium]
MLQDKKNNKVCGAGIKRHTLAQPENTRPGVRRHTPRHCRPGLSMVEILIALTIAAMLLTATAAAFDAALTSYRSNYDMSVVGVSSRNAMYQMCSTIRSAWNDPDYDTIDVTTDGTQCSLVDANGWDVEYRYNASTNEMQVRVDRGSGWSDWFIMVDNVVPVATGEKIFTDFDPEDTDFPAGTIGKVIIRFRVQQEGINQSVTASAVPRNVVYN